MPKRVPTFKNYRLKTKVVEARPNAHERGYCSKRHKAWRKAILNRDNFKCNECGHVECLPNYHTPMIDLPDYHIEESHLILNGVCKACRKELQAAD